MRQQLLTCLETFVLAVEVESDLPEYTRHVSGLGVAYEQHRLDKICPGYRDRASKDDPDIASLLTGMFFSFSWFLPVSLYQLKMRAEPDRSLLRSAVDTVKAYQACGGLFREDTTKERASPYHQTEKERRQEIQWKKEEEERKSTTFDYQVNVWKSIQQEYPDILPYFGRGLGGKHIVEPGGDLREAAWWAEREKHLELERQR